MFKNQTGQKWTVLAFNRTTGEHKTGDAAQITAKVSIDNGTPAAVADTNPDEVEDGFYRFDLSQAETNGDKLELFAESSTANVNVIAWPVVIYTRPANFSALSIEADGDLTKVNSLDGHTAQTGDSFARIGSNGSGLSSITTDIAGVRGVVDAVLVDTSTTLDGKLDDIITDTGTDIPVSIVGMRGVVDAIYTDTNTEISDIKTVTDKLDGTVEFSGSAWQFTTSALSNSHASPVVSQIPIPPSRTFVMERDATGGLAASGPARGIQTSETLMWAADFGRELGAGDYINAISSVAIQSGTAGGLTFTAADQGVNLSQAKFSTTAVTASATPYTVRVKVTTANGDTLEGDVKLKVISQ